MTKFKAGDKFIPRMTKTNAAEWNRHMKLYDGETLIVEQITTDGYIRPKDFGVCLFHPDWCEKVEDNQSVETNEMVAENHIPDVTKMVDWEQRRYELAKSAMQGLLSNRDINRFGGCNGSQYDISICACELADKMIKQLKEQ